MNIQQKFDRLIENIPDQAIEVSDKSNIYQCMDFAYLWVFILGYPKATIQHTYAYEVFTKPTDLAKQYFDIIPNTPEFVPQIGDLGVFGKDVGVAGHICVCTGEGNQTTFKSRDQNWSNQSKVALITHQYGGKNYFLGVLRPKVFDDACLLFNDEPGRQVYAKLVHNSDIADQTVRKLELGPNADAISFDTIEKSLAARDGKLTTCTTQLNDKESALAKSEAEVKNRIEQVGRLQADVTAAENKQKDAEIALNTEAQKRAEDNKQNTAALVQAKADFQAEAKAKGTALADLAEAKKQLEIAQKGAIGTISFGQWLSLLGSVKWN